MPQHCLEQLVASAKNHPDEIAFKYCIPGKETPISNAELLSAVKSMAQHIARTYQPGDRLLLIFEPGLEFIIAIFGCIYAGIIAVPVYPPDMRRKQRDLSMRRLVKIIENSKPTAILCSKLIKILLMKAKALNHIERASIFINRKKDCIESFKLYNLPTIKCCYTKPAPDYTMQYNDICYLQYTSGTTGTVKGVIIKHSNIINNVTNTTGCIKEHNRLVETSVSWLPLYHDMGLINSVFLPIIYKIPSIITSPLEFLKNPIFWLELISKHKNVVSGGPNFSFGLCTRKFTANESTIDLSSWNIAYTGAEKIRCKTFTEFTETFADYGFKASALTASYGLAEITLYASDDTRNKGIVSEYFEKKGDIFTHTENGSIKLVSVGKCSPDHELVIANPDDLTPLPNNYLGEICIRGPSVADGYWHNEALTESIFKAKIHSKSFMRTGDLGFIHQGNLYIYSRKKDILIFNGTSISPEDIEWCLRDCDAIKPGGCAAFSIDSDDKEQLVIIAEVRNAKQLNENLIKAIRGMVSRECGLRTHKIGIVAANTIPRTSSGKIKRILCKEKFLNNELRILVSG
jgi:acyl-CoA synthetase (AMP-forming)/AMP-acid ligase II